MKKLLLIAATFVAGFSAMAQQKVEDIAKFNTETYNFGKIKQGTPVTTYFEITNTRDKPVVIENVTAGCGCTTPEHSKEPIAPNGVSKIKVGYNAAAAAPFNKEVYVKLAGIQQPKVIKITGEVLDAAAYDTYVKSDEYKKAEQAKAAEAKKVAKATKNSSKKK